MAKINTLNYQTVAAWNGSQDLFVVEQPDGTKVATPAMVKQFIEAGDFEATGEVKDGYGNKLADMAKADEVKGLAEAGDFEATGEVKDGHGNILKDMAKSESGTVTSILFDTNRIAVSSQNIKYKKIGNIVTVYGDVTFGAKVTTSGNYINAGRLPLISNIQSIITGKIVSDTGITMPYEAVSKGGTSSVWFSYNGTNELNTSYFENKKFYLDLSYVVS